MGIMELYLTNTAAFNADRRIGERTFVIRLSNGKRIAVEKEPEHNGEIWAWKVDGQYFDADRYALDYLKRLVTEKLTGKRILFHAKQPVPDICGVDGTGCRAKGECNTVLCSDCPVAEKFFADRDGVELVYAIR